MLNFNENLFLFLQKAIFNPFLYFVVRTCIEIIATNIVGDVQPNLFQLYEFSIPCTKANITYKVLLEYE